MRKVSYCKKNFTNTECITVCYGGRYNDVDAVHAMEGGEGNEIMKGLHRDEAFDY